MSEGSSSAPDFQTGSSPSPPMISTPPHYSTQYPLYPPYNSPYTQYTAYPPNNPPCNPPYPHHAFSSAHHDMMVTSPKVSPSCSRKTSVESAPATLDTSSTSISVDTTPRPSIDQTHSGGGMLGGAPTIMLTFDPHLEQGVAPGAGPVAGEMVGDMEIQGDLPNLQPGLTRRHTGSSLWKGERHNSLGAPGLIWVSIVIMTYCMLTKQEPLRYLAILSCFE